MNNKVKEIGLFTLGLVLLTLGILSWFKALATDSKREYNMLLISGFILIPIGAWLFGEAADVRHQVNQIK